MTTFFLLDIKGGTNLFLERPFLGPDFSYMAKCGKILKPDQGISKSVMLFSLGFCLREDLPDGVLLNHLSALRHSTSMHVPVGTIYMAQANVHILPVVPCLLNLVRLCICLRWLAYFTMV